jgi:hypothetical protein
MMSNVNEGALGFEGAAGQPDRDLAATEATPGLTAENSSSGLLRKAGETAADIKAFAVSKAHDVRDVAKEKSEELAALIRARPVESVLVGLAAGWLLGWLASKAVQSRTDSRRR